MQRIISISAALLLLASSGVFSQPEPEPVVPVNDRCVNSVTLMMGEKVLGDNSNANFDYTNQGVCGSRSDRRAVWYEILGAGKEVTVEVCTNNEQITDFGVFRICNTQNCLGAPPQQLIATSCENDESNEYVFFGNEGESYFIHVRSDVFFEGGVGSNHTIWYTEPTDAPSTAPADDGSGSASYGGLAGFVSTMIAGIFISISL